jgi:hypothetical protein
MAKTYSTTKEFGGSGGNAVEKPGTYHFAITKAAEGETTKGNPMTGMSAVCVVLDGTNPDQKGKEFHLHLWEPDLSKSEKAQEMALKKITSYGVAINQFDPLKLGGDLAGEFGSALEGQQFIMQLEEDTYEGKTNLQVHYANIYHVDDPRAEKFPKDKDAIALIAKEFRKSPNQFPSKEKNGHGNGNGAPASKQTRLTEAELASL